MKLVSLSDKLSLSAVVQGFWRLEDWKWTTEELVKFMNACIDRGVTSFDTAEIYSATLCEKMMGEAFAVQIERQISKYRMPHHPKQRFHTDLPLSDCRMPVLMRTKRHHTVIEMYRFQKTEA